MYVPPVRSARFDLFIDDPSPPFFIFPCKIFLSLFFLASFCLCNSAKVGLKSRRVLLEYFFLSFFFARSRCVFAGSCCVLAPAGVVHVGCFLCSSSSVDVRLPPFHVRT